MKRNAQSIPITARIPGSKRELSSLAMGLGSLDVEVDMFERCSRALVGRRPRLNAQHGTLPGSWQAGNPYDDRVIRGQPVLLIANELIDGTFSPLSDP